MGISRGCQCGMRRGRRIARSLTSLEALKELLMLPVIDIVRSSSSSEFSSYVCLEGSSGLRYS